MQSNNDTTKPMKSLYKTPQDLRSLHPYRPPVQEDPLALHNGFGVFSLEKNIIALRTHPDNQKIVALKLISTNLNSPEQKLRALKLSLIPELVNTSSSKNEKIFRLCCEIAQKLCSVNQGKNLLLGNESFFKQLLNKFDNLSEISEQHLAAIRTISAMSIYSSLLGNKNLLITSDTVVTLVKNLSFIPFEKDQNNVSTQRKNLLLITMEALCEMSRIPQGRELCASSQILPAINLILKNKEIRENNEKMVEATGQLVWNVCLDGDGKKLATEEGIVQSLFLALEHHQRNPKLVRVLAGAITSIVVYEPAKELTPYAMPLLCRMLHVYYSGNNGQDVTLLTNEFRNDIVTNLVLCLKLCSEYPKSRDSIRERFNAHLKPDSSCTDKDAADYLHMIFPIKSSAEDDDDV
jgi:hypothetical protein